MDRLAWVRQIKSQVEKYGAENAAWHVFWKDPDTRAGRSKSCGKGKAGKSAANRLAEQIHAQLVLGTYGNDQREMWSEFRTRFNEHVEAMSADYSRKAALLSVGTFERIAKPGRMKSVNADMIDKFIAARLAEKTKRKGADGKPAKVSPATVNRELRYLKSALNLAMDWKFITEIPRIRFLKPLDKMPTFVTSEHLAAIYGACDAARFPRDIPNVTPADWWRGLMVFLFMTGWRIGQTLSLRWEDVDLDKGTALTKAGNNKGGRDQLIPLHPLAVDHLRKLAGSFDSLVFPWSNHERILWDEFARIQESARLPDNSPLPRCGKNGSWYGFHDLRRGFATENASGMNLFQLQSLMQHRSLETTKGYVSMAGRLNQVVSGLFVPILPSVPRIAESG